MAGDYGVCVANKFVLLDDEEGDPLEALQKSEVKAKKEEKPKVSADKVSDKNKNVKKPSAVVPEKKTEKPTGQTTKREVERPPRLQNRPQSQTGPRPEGERRRFPRENLDGQSLEINNRTERGRGRGRGGGRDSRQPGDFDRFGKREFERHSGSDKTGVKPVVKREGGGAHNWGQSIDQQWIMNKETEAPAELEESVDASQNVATEAVPAEGEAGDSQTAETIEENVNEMTLDEWKAANEKNRVKAEFNIRKPNEGQEDPKWKKMFVLKKTNDDENEDDEEETSENEEDHHNKKNLLNIEITFGDNSRRGFGRRGGRGGGRGRGRGGDRHYSSETKGAPHVDDQAEFPALGGTA